MANHGNFKQQVWRAATITVALAACLIFGIIVLAGGDWLPGGIIVGASSVGLARQIPVIRDLCSTESPASPRKHHSAEQGGPTFGYHHRQRLTNSSRRVERRRHGYSDD